MGWAADDSALPTWEPGAHLIFELPNGLHNSYSLANDPGEFDNLWDDVPLRADRLKVHLDAMAATVSAGPPRSALY